MQIPNKNAITSIVTSPHKTAGKDFRSATQTSMQSGITPRKIIFHIIYSILLVTGIGMYTTPTAHADTVDIAIETFAAKSWKAGPGWVEGWYHEGDARVVSNGRPHSGSYHMRLRARDAWTDRPLNLTGYRNARLGLFVKVKSFEKNDYAVLMVKSGNDNWKALRRFTSDDANNRYQYYEFDLSPYGLKENFWIGFEAEMSGRGDHFYVDDIRVFTEVPSNPVPPDPIDDPIFDVTAEPILGVTIDDISDADKIKDSLSRLARRPLARIVFDEYVKPSYYKDTVADLHNVSGIMGEILDSFYVEEYSRKQYEQRTRDYVKTMANVVDVWEVGNEINGEWLGKGAMDKAAAAYDIVKAAGEPTALTLYYNGTYDNGEPTSQNCWERPEHQMETWAENNVPERMKQGLDYVLVSFYEEDCENISPNWDRIFNDLHNLFPNSKIGFGEIGTTDKSKKEALIRKYYGMKRIRPEFIGGFFWWYFNNDMVLNDSGMLNTLNDAVSSWDDIYDLH